MITIIGIAYCALVIVAFKVIKIKVVPTTIATAALIGVFLMTFIVVSWKMAAPISGQIFLRRHVMRVNPDVREFVAKVHVKGNDMVKKGDALFDVAPDRYQDILDQSNAELEAAKSTVSQLEADVTASEASVKQSVAETATAKAQLDTALALEKSNPGAIAKLKLQEAQQNYASGQADDKVKEASLKQAQFSLAAAKGSVDVAQSGVDVAKFNRGKCTYTSPVDGQIINWQITEGTPAARWRFTTIGTIQDFSDTAINAIYPQNQLKNVKPDNVVEIAFKSRPGQIATGKVEAVVKYTGEGQFMPSMNVPIAADVGSKGYLAVRIRLDDADLAKQLPLGAAGTLAIYTDTGKTWQIISKIVVRMKAWQNYLPM
jgi:multidrug resistance efflux pump